MIYCFDVDGTLCTNTDGKYEKAEPYPNVIARVNTLHDGGHRIILYTARGSTTGIDWRALTEQQLQTWGVRYHELRFGKPNADIFVDDKAINVTEIRAPNSRSEAGVKRAFGSPEALKKKEYLDLTYSTARTPYTAYPYLLAKWLHDNVYRRIGRLLDIGCGRGENLAACAQLGFEPVGIDVSSRAQEMSSGFRVEIADLEHEPLPVLPGTFDFVFSKSVIEHMREPSRLLTAAYEALKPGGIAVIMTPSWAHTYWGPFYIDNTHVTPFTAPSLADALTLAGFESIKVSHFYQLPFLWRCPFLKPIVWIVAALPLPYRPYQSAPWPDSLNKVIRFSKEVMLLAVGQKPKR